MDKYFEYGDKETEYLKSKDVRLAKVIDQIGHIDRPVDTDLFSSVIRIIIGQQISTKAQKTIWKRMEDAFGEITPQKINDASVEELQSFGTTFKKVEYMKDFAEKIVNGEFDLDAIASMTDEEAIAALVALKGIGEWTAEMLLLHCLQRPNIFSYGDLAILRGIRIVYHHKKVDKKLFEKYRRRFSPYCSVASLYFWAVAGGQYDVTPKESET